MLRSLFRLGLVGSLVWVGVAVAHPAAVLAAPGCPVSYVVKRGDSPWKVAQKTRPPGTTVLAASEQISKLNPRASSWQVGSRICLPAGSRASAAPAPAPTAAPAPPRTYTTAEIRQMIRDTFPDGRAEEVALYVAYRESKFRPGVKTWCCSGVFQIYYKWHKGRLARLGIDSEADLLNPVLNIKAAYDIYRSSGWGPWCTRALKARFPDLRACK